MNLVSTPDGRIINLDHLTYGEYVILHFIGGGGFALFLVLRHQKKAWLYYKSL